MGIEQNVLGQKSRLKPLFFLIYTGQAGMPQRAFAGSTGHKENKTMNAEIQAKIDALNASVAQLEELETQAEERLQNEIKAVMDALPGFAPCLIEDDSTYTLKLPGAKAVWYEVCTNGVKGSKVDITYYSYYNPEEIKQRLFEVLESAQSEAERRIQISKSVAVTFP